MALPTLLTLFCFVARLSANRLPPFYAIDQLHFPVPEGVMPRLANWAPKGDLVVFNDLNKGDIWLVDTNKNKTKCVSCSMSDSPKIQNAFTYVLPDYKRIFVAGELGPAVYMVECADTVWTCDKYKWYQVDLSGDIDPASPSIGRRTYHMAPDGAHLGYTNQQLNGLIMIVTELSKNSTHYFGVDYKVVNPSPEPTGADSSLQSFLNVAPLYELKTFADSGRSIIFVGSYTEGNLDQFKMDLKTGDVTRITSNPDWDEDGAPSPDNSLHAVASWRTQHRIDTLGLLEPDLPFLSFLPAAALAGYYVSTFQCDLQTWLLQPQGDLPGRVGQPVAPYLGGNMYTHNNLAGQNIWSPDSNKIILQESFFSAPPGSNEVVVNKLASPNRVTVAKLAKAPGAVPKAETTVVGKWAPKPQGYLGLTAFQGSHTFKGKHGGSVNVTMIGSLSQASKFSVTYDRYSGDGHSFLDGVSTVEGSIQLPMNITSDVRVTDQRGNAIGYKDISINITSITPAPEAWLPQTQMEAETVVSWGGTTRNTLARVGTCFNTLPQESPLFLAITRSSTGIKAVVTADIYGDVRPVQGAVVTIGHQTATTGSDGGAFLRCALNQCRFGAIVASAGTFKSVTRSLSSCRPM